MCGIVGLVWSGQESDREGLLASAVMRLKHRGPDDAAIYVDDRVGFAHSRLSIVDTAGGKQPYTAEGRDEILVYNGEIFNYDELKALLSKHGVALRSHSDTEALFWLLVIFGREAISRINGQFAFCFYDPREGSLLLARDGFGEKPLFYARQGGRIAFASEVKALHRLGVSNLKLSLAQLHSMARYWATVPSASPFDGVEQLPPGHSLVYRDGNVQIRCEQTPLSPSSPSDMQDLSFRLASSVSGRMRSDVPVALLLSGGLDSSVIGEEMRGAVSDGDLRSYSIGFPQAEFDERVFQETMAHHLDARHLRVEYGGDEMAEDLDDAIFAAESPSPRLAFVALFALHRRIHQSNIRVVLSGEGSDEMFFGYDLFSEVYIQDSIRRGSTYDDLSDHVATVNTFMANDPRYHHLAQLKYANYRALSRVQAWNASHLQRASLSAKLLQFLNPFEPANTDEAWHAYLNGRYEKFDAFDVYRRAQILEVETLLSGHLLSTQGDRISMAHSVETRMPFLDPGIAAYSVAQDARTTFFASPVEKAVLKDRYRGRLPDKILDRKKYPFRAPDSVSLLSGQRGRSYVGDLIADIADVGDVIDIAKSRAFIEKCLSSGASSPRDNFAFVLLLTTVALVRSLKRLGEVKPIPVCKPYLQTRFGQISSVENW